MAAAPRENADLYSTGHIRLVMIGNTGWGKSTTGNTLAKRPLFDSASSGDSVTTECNAFKVQIGQHTVALMDTPGFSDSGSRDSQHMEKIVSECKQFQSVHYFMLVAPSTQLRMDGKVRSMMKQLTESFSADIVEHLILCVTHWGYSKKALKKRVKTGQTQDVIHNNWAGFCRQEFARPDDFTMPMLLLDNAYDEEDSEDEAGFTEQMQRLDRILCNARAFRTVDAQAQQTEADQLKGQLSAIKENLELTIVYAGEVLLITPDMSVRGNTTVEVLKALIREKKGWNVQGNWWLSYEPAGASAVSNLANTRTLASYKIRSGDTLEIGGDVHGGMLASRNRSLRNAPRKDMSGGGHTTQGVPARRLCPACSMKMNHQGGCKVVYCPNPKCRARFCMSCLRVAPKGGDTECHVKPCWVAPIQQVTA